jgi:hypothetical protein
MATGGNELAAGYAAFPTAWVRTADYLSPRYAPRSPAFMAVAQDKGLTSQPASARS